MRILAIETSCDETAIAIVDRDEKGAFRILANEIISQAELHSQYGGVFPAMAKREHARNIVPLLLLSLERSGLLKNGGVLTSEKKTQILDILSRERDLGEAFVREVGSVCSPNIDRIVVTQGPGLEPALWVGINFARALGVCWDVPVFPVNHMEGHILSALYDKEKGEFPTIDYPVVALLISGGHTELVRMDGIGQYALLGETLDDAVGECFDKVARMLSLPYPGGPEISTLAERGHAGVYALPRPMIHSGDYRFSFSGLKTAVLYLVKKLGDLSLEMKADIAREFEEAVVEVLVAKSRNALRETGASALLVGGGVSANTRIREGLRKMCQEEGVRVHIPDRVHSTDNAFMIALAGSEGIIPQSHAPLHAKGQWKLHGEKL